MSKNTVLYFSNGEEMTIKINRDSTYFKDHPSKEFMEDADILKEAIHVLQAGLEDMVKGEVIYTDNGLVGVEVSKPTIEMSDADCLEVASRLIKELKEKI